MPCFKLNLTTRQKHDSLFDDMSSFNDNHKDSQIVETACFNTR